MNFKTTFGHLRQAKAAIVYRSSGFHVFRCSCGLVQRTCTSKDSMESGACNTCLATKERRAFIQAKLPFKFKKCRYCMKVMQLHRHPGLVSADLCRLCQRLDSRLQQHTPTGNEVGADNFDAISAQPTVIDSLENSKKTLHDATVNISDEFESDQVS